MLGNLFFAQILISRFSSANIFCPIQFLFLLGLFCSNFCHQIQFFLCSKLFGNFPPHPSLIYHPPPPHRPPISSRSFSRAISTTVSGKLDFDHVINARQNRIELRGKILSFIFSCFTLLFPILWPSMKGSHLSWLER